MILSLAKNAPPTGMAPATKKLYMALLLTKGLLRNCYD